MKILDKIKLYYKDMVACGWSMKIFKARRKARAEKCLALVELFVNSMTAYNKALQDENQFLRELALAFIPDNFRTQWGIIASQPLPDKYKRNGYVVEPNINKEIS
jgi:hypothetical protein